MVEIDTLLRYNSAYFLDEWIQYNEETWHMKGERVCYCEEGKEVPRLECVLYLDHKGRVVLPPNNTYLPVRFVSTNTTKKCQLYTQWTNLSKMLAEDIKKRGWKGAIVFPPGMIDGRAFQWMGINISMNYTFVGELPVNESELDTSVRKNIRKAIRMGYTVERTRDWEKIIDCLEKTEYAKGFSNLMTQNYLRKCDELLSEKYLFAHIAYSSEHETVAAQVKLAMPEGICIDWLAGTDREHIRNGVNQLLYMRSLQDIAATGTLLFDNCGANIESVAKAKSTWGYTLVPYVMIPEDPYKLKIKFYAQKSMVVRRIYASLNRIKHKV